MQTIFRKLTVVALLIALVFAALPLSSSYAAGISDTATPPAPGVKADPALVKARLELTFSRQQMRVLVIGQAVTNFDLVSANVQKLLDKARERGLDVSAVQAAFTAYKEAFNRGKPFYEQAKEIVNARPGFNPAGKVTDIEQAKTTVKSLADVIKQYRDTVGASFKALREAIKAFREANPRPTPTPSVPTNG
jgi:hypothetical protein